EVYYTYFGEEKDGNGQKGFYIDVTADVKNIITNNPLVKQQIFKIVNEFTIDPNSPKESSIVMYGSPVAGTEIDGVVYDKTKHGNVLFKRDISADGKTITDTHINITSEIIRELKKETNTEFRETIKEITRVEIKPGTGTDGNSGGDVFTNEVVDGYMVYKGSAVVKVEDASYGYDSTFNGNITLKPMKLAADGKTLEEDTTVNIQKLKSIVVTNKTTKEFGVNTATEVTAAGKSLKFHFGVGSMYTSLTNGDYEVIFEYISDKKVK
ncbi:MAG: hypothetical protein LBI72_14270, partial [Flavobacteriaceae bacterium]|nr:hypothetical protein [Flavobacteriaceae bacterium]